MIWQMTLRQGSSGPVGTFTAAWASDLYGALANTPLQLGLFTSYGGPDGHPDDGRLDPHLDGAGIGIGVGPSTCTPSGVSDTTSQATFLFLAPVVLIGWALGPPNRRASAAATYTEAASNTSSLMSKLA